MGYLLYTILVFSIAITTALYYNKARWAPYLPDSLRDRINDFADRINPSNFSYNYTRLPSSFMSDVEGGLTSADFDLSSNVMEGDSRTGLDENAKREVQRLMRARGVNFDEARRVYMEAGFKKHGIGKDGVPRDPKFVSFS